MLRKDRAVRLGHNASLTTQSVASRSWRRHGSGVQGRALLRLLKEQTALLHREAECYVRILDADARIDDYRRYLVAMHGYVAPLEQRLVDTLGSERCTKAAWALHDLAALGETTILPRCNDLPRVDDLARALGCGYVLEGSTLGGRYILAKLPPALRALRGRATRYLEGYGSATGDRWKSFGALLESSAIDADIACDAACETFARLIGWLACFEERRTPVPAEAAS